MAKNIALVGFMGTGKTAVAREIAKRLKMKYTSADDLIEKQEGKKIADIFKENGEPYFREVEQKIIKELSSQDNSVIDAGGGAVLCDENMNNLCRNGIIICLTASVDTILARTQGRSRRPLLNVDDPRKKIEELLARRAPFYAKADYTIDTTNLNIADVAEKVIDIYMNKM